MGAVPLQHTSRTHPPSPSYVAPGAAPAGGDRAGLSRAKQAPSSPALDTPQTQTLFTGAARGYPLLSQALSFGQYLRWRDRLVAVAGEHGIDAGSRVLDVATGTGLIARRLAQQTGAQVTGIDLTKAMLHAARAHTRDDHARRLVIGDARRLPVVEDHFDAVTMSYLLRYVEDPQATLNHLVAHVRPGGLFAFIEFHVPDQALLRGLWRLHTRLVLPVGGAIAGPGWWRVGRFLGPNIDAFWQDKDRTTIRGYLEKAGLEDIQVETPSFAGGLVAYGRRRARGPP